MSPVLTAEWRSLVIGTRVSFRAHAAAWEKMAFAKIARMRIIPPDNR